MKCPHCMKNSIRATLMAVETSRGLVKRCWQCGGEYQGDVMIYPKRSIEVRVRYEDERGRRTTEKKGSGKIT